VREYLLCLAVAAAVTYLTTPVARKLALRWGAMAEVRDRDVHAVPVPRLGGLAMFAGLLAAFAVAWQLPLMSSVFDSSREAFGLLSACAILVALGVADDKWGLDAPTKFVGQALAAAVMSLQGVSILWLPINGTFQLDPLTSTLLTVLVVVVAVNAVNFVDGLDGLAAGIVGIGAVAFFAYSYLLAVENGFTRATLATLICACLAGMCAGFLPHNLYPAKLFMGDTGSMLIGLLLAASVITLSGQLDPSALGTSVLLPALLPVLLPVAVIAVPLVDLVLAVVRRTRARRSPFAPDKEHLHHRLLELGHSQRRAVLLMYGWSGVIAFTAVSLAFVRPSVSFAFFVAGVAGLAVAVRWPRLRRHFVAG
jgi:UDP-GlcNAc:undecaprenyl-phosphate/decaprenyl-phosphate GlcNAc-1-phosphate transferase